MEIGQCATNGMFGYFDPATDQVTCQEADVRLFAQRLHGHVGLALEAPLHVPHIEGWGGEPLGAPADLLYRTEQEDGIRIHEAPDQPRTGDAIDLRPGSGHPTGTFLTMCRRNDRQWNQ